MDLVFALACLVLVGVFVVAAVAKLADRAGTPDAVRAFGVPDALAAPVATALPVAELGVAALLLFPATSLWGGVGALALLAAFIVAIAANLARGRRPACHCFGQVHAAPVGWETLARNAVLAASAALVVVRARDGDAPSIAQVVSRASGGHGAAAVAAILAAALIVAQGWVILHLLRQQGRLLLRVDAVESSLRNVGLLGPDAPRPAAGLRVGTAAPAFELPSLGGERVSLDRLRRAGRRVVLVFSESGCRPCAELLPELGQWGRQHADAVSFALVTRGVTAEYRAQVAAARIETVLVQHDREVAESFAATATPSAVIVEEDGTIGSELAMGAVAIRSLLAQALAPRAPRSGALAAMPAPAAPPPMPPALPVGMAVPTFRLPDLDGAVVDTASFRGRSHLLLFWSPGCGYCKQMLPELRAWERNEGDGQPALVVVSSGTVDVNRAQGLRAPVLLDQYFEMGLSFGVLGTPSAALVDADGTLLAPIAVGAPAIFAAASAATASDAAMAAVGGAA